LPTHYGVYTKPAPRLRKQFVERDNDRQRDPIRIYTLPKASYRVATQNSKFFDVRCPFF